MRLQSRVVQLLKRFALNTARHSWHIIRDARSDIDQLSAGRRMKRYDRLQLGSGPKPMAGWGNIDLHADFSQDGIRWDLTRPFPILPNSVRLIYSEHFLEHVTRDQALAILKNCYTVLEPGGRIRISTPDLARVVQNYLNGIADPLEDPAWTPETPCQMLNESLHNWGHQFVFDEAELRLLLERAGFVEVERMKHSVSSHPELCNLETREDAGDLIMEGVKAPTETTG